MTTPTITRVSLEPFCPACGGGLGVQEWNEPVAIYIKGRGVPLRLAELFAPICPWCGKMLETSEIAWREREKEEE